MAINRVINVEVGLIYTKVCETSYRKKNTKVYRAFIFDTPENTIEDGYIRDKQNFADELKRQLTTHRMKNKNIVFTIASNKILSREVVIPAVKEKRIMDIVKAEANEYFPMDITEHILTYTLLSEMPETKQLRILVFAAPMTLVKNYYSLAEMMGLSIVALDYIGNSSYQILKRLPGEEVNFIVQLNQQNTLVSIIQQGALLMQRNVNFGVANLVDLLKSFDSYASLGTQECYDLLCDKQLLKERMDGENENIPEESVEIVDELMEELRMFINNINRVMEYFNGKEQNQKAAKVYLVGKGTNIKGLSSLLENELNLPIEIITSLHGIVFKKLDEKLQGHTNELFSCVGAALKPVNFIPEELLNKSKQHNDNRLYFLLFLLVVVASGTLVFNSYMDYQDAKWQNEDLKEEAESYAFIEQIFNAYIASENALAEAKNMEAGTFAYPEYLNELIAELEKELPSNSIVQSLSATDSGVFLSFVTDSKQTAAKLLAQLKKIPYVGSTSVSGITENGGEDGKEATVIFSVSLTWKIPQEVNANE